MFVLMMLACGDDASNTDGSIHITVRFDAGKWGYVTCLEAGKPPLLVSVDDELTEHACGPTEVVVSPVAEGSHALQITGGDWASEPKAVAVTAGEITETEVTMVCQVADCGV